MSRLILSLLFVATLVSTSFASWEGPETIVSGGWGDSAGKFGIVSTDMGYEQPVLVAILPIGEILIRDWTNRKMLVFDRFGKLKKEVFYQETIDKDGRKVFQLSEYKIAHIKRFESNGNFWSGRRNKAKLLSPAGMILAEYDNNPLALGLKSSRRRAATDNKYDTTVQFDDITYHMILEGDWDDFVRDQRDNLYFYNTYSANDPVSGEISLTSLVVKYNTCGKLIGRLDLPISEYEKPTQEELDMPTTVLRVRNEYGPPVIGPDGSVYAYKRTPNTYSILKWTWVDETGDPKSECKK